MADHLTGTTYHPTYDPAASVARIRDLHRSLTPDGGVLAGVDLDLCAGQVVALMGRRGSGKTTLLRALARLDQEVVGHGTLRAPTSVAVLGDEPRLLGWRRILDNVTSGLEDPDSLDRGRHALAEVGLAGRELDWPGDLDAGEQHRAAIARALAGSPELVLADEPFRRLDALTQRGLHRLVRTVCGNHRLAVLFVTNDVHEAITLADRVVTLRDGRVHRDLAVRVSGAVPVADEYAALRSLLLGEIGIGAATDSAVADHRAVRPRRETA
ncbi:ATP-binding cassette domain-containing protein [Nocardioides sp. DS6]|uniref:ATP-binding cassette domain-containing protein n=1 Tax=Nocardioides eburneus TaxID=3231482 RepID=A0ABV3T655_9ACTN